MRSIALLGILFHAALGGCGDSPTTADAAPDPDTPPLAFTTIATLAGAGAGVAAFNGDLYVGIAAENQIVKITPSGSVTKLTDGPIDSRMYILGLAANPAGDIFFTVAWRDRDPPRSQGVYKVPAAGGALTTVVGDLQGLLAPRDLDIDGGKLYVTERYSERVYQVNASGTLSVWAQSALLARDRTACGTPRLYCDNVVCDAQGGGAGGIAHDANNRYVTEPDHGRILRIPINADGSAGTPVVYAESCSELHGIVDIAVKEPGVLIGVRSVPTDAIVVIEDNGQRIKTLHEGPPLARPDSITYDTVGNRWVVTNPAFNRPTPAPSVLAFTLP
jgi:hypothetical protein